MWKGGALRLRDFAFMAASGAWLVAVAGGFVALLRYEFTAGVLRVASARPSTLHSDRPTLVMAVHPRCPCTRASLAELARLAPRLRARADIIALVYRPDSESDDWAHTGRWAEASSIPMVDVRIDEGGRLAGTLGLETSGAVVLFDSTGAPIFTGGITAGRGHEGPNPGRDALLAWADGKRLPVSRTPAFGCGLRTCARAEENCGTEPKK